MKGRELNGVAEHWFGCRGNCPSCQFAWHFNLFRQFCHCGLPATGYRAMGLDLDVEFFCDAHFQDVPCALTGSTETEKVNDDDKTFARVGRL